MLITGDDEASIRHLKDLISNEFHMKDVDPLTYLLHWKLNIILGDVCSSKEI